MSSLLSAIDTHSLPFDTTLSLHMEPFERPLVEFTDALVSLAKRYGCKDQVETKGDLKVLEFIYRGFSVLYPKSATYFEEKMADTRQRHWQNKGISKEHGALLQYQLEVPNVLYGMIKALFPLQVWDQKFIRTLGQCLPQLKAVA